jgi:hypothetical protein
MKQITHAIRADLTLASEREKPHAGISAAYCETRNGGANACRLMV